MAITTRIAPMYAGQKMFAAVLCAVFGVWGAYDYFVKYPEIDRIHTEYVQLDARFKELTQKAVDQKVLTQDEVELAQTQEKLLALTGPDRAAPRKLSKWDRPIQWVYIACLPFAPWFFVMFLKAKQQKYTLDDEGALHFAGDKEHQTGVWSASEIADIDMSRWMAKSIAHAVHADGRRLMLDAYIHKDLHLIVGALASRFYPDQWDAEAKIVKHEEEAAGENENAAAVEQQAT